MIVRRNRVTRVAQVIKTVKLVELSLRESLSFLFTEKPIG